MRALLAAYARSLEINPDYQNFAVELWALPGNYPPPAGCLLLAWAEQGLAGFVALKPRDGTIV